MSEQPSVDVERRRKADKPTERAEAPIRRQTGGGGGGPSRPSGGGGINIPTKGKMGGCGGILILILIIGYYLLSGGGGGNQETHSSFGRANRKQSNHAKPTHQHTTPNAGTCGWTNWPELAGDAVPGRG